MLLQLAPMTAVNMSQEAASSSGLSADMAFKKVF